MSDRDNCLQMEEHHLHVCALKVKEMHAEIEKLYQDPHFVCTNCGAKVNKAENVCAPKSLD
ncbi:MAG: hypothetical protein RQ754_07340 [Desulfuromonadales bacterium]|nr:hypothetical protein [Desulfuromonadales bacterium]